MVTAQTFAGLVQKTGGDHHMPKDSKISHPRRFDQSTYNQISGMDARLLEAIDYDARVNQKHRPTRAKYSDKPQAYFAKILGVCRETISDSVRKLEKLGILDITRRRRVRDRWQTNLYKIRSWIWWRLAKALRSLRSTPSHVTTTSHIATPKRVINNQETPPTGVGALLSSQILERWRLRSPSGVSFP